MAKKNYTPNADGRSAEDKAMDKFAELMIEKISNLQGDWKKPWFSPQAAQLPRNLSGHQYNGMNSIILMLMQEKNGWQTSRYATFDRIMGLNYVKDKEGGRTPALEEERAKYNVYPKLQVYNVFNLDQTNMKEARPDMYEKFLKESKGEREASDKEMESFPAIDAMIEKDLWVCPIKPTHGDNAYYSISKDMIVVPEKQQFIDGESFYSNLLHEMAHSTGSESRLNRLKPGQSFGSAEYAREELVAELTAALVSSQYGMTKHVKSDSAAYLKGWLSNLKEDPSYIKTTLLDVKRSASFIGQRVDAVNMRIERDGVNADFSDIRDQNKTYAPTHQASKPSGHTTTEEEKPKQEEVKSEQQEQLAARGVDPPRFHR